jgi:hypothetical protein
VQVGHPGTAARAAKALPQGKHGEILSIALNEVGSEENALVFAAPAHGDERHLGARELSKRATEAGFSRIAIAGTHLMGKLHPDHMVAARKLPGPEAGYKASTDACRRREMGVAE